MTTDRLHDGQWRLVEMLDALDGNAYVTDIQGRLACVGSEAWARFAYDNGASALALAPPIGRPVEDSILGDAVRAIYLGAHQTAMAQGRRITFAFRCDAPDVERRMKMSISPLRRGSEVVGILYQATILSEKSRPPMRFLEPGAAYEQYKEDTAPILRMCSFCARVECPLGGSGTWLIPEIYYQRGGTSEVRISHAVCAECSSRLESATS